MQAWAAALIGDDQLKYLKEGMECTGLVHDEQVILLDEGKLTNVHDGQFFTGHCLTNDMAHRILRMGITGTVLVPLGELLHLSTAQRDIPRMIAKGILLFIRKIMLFINDDEAEA